MRIDRCPALPHALRRPARGGGARPGRDVCTRFRGAPIMAAPSGGGRIMFLAKAVCAASLLLPLVAFAQAYPNKPIRLLSTLAGGAEGLHRVLMQKAGDAL